MRLCAFSLDALRLCACGLGGFEALPFRRFPKALLFPFGVLCACGVRGAKVKNVQQRLVAAHGVHTRVLPHGVSLASALCGGACVFIVAAAVCVFWWWPVAFHFARLGLVVPEVVVRATLGDAQWVSTAKLLWQLQSWVANGPNRLVEARRGNEHCE